MLKLSKLSDINLNPYEYGNIYGCVAMSKDLHYNTGVPTLDMSHTHNDSPDADKAVISRTKIEHFDNCG